MTASEKHSKELAKVAEKIALEEFDKVTDNHTFSEGYQQRKATFLNDLPEQNKQKNYKNRLIAIAAGLLIGIPTTAFAAIKLYDMVVKKDNYEVNVSVKGQANKEKTGDFYKLNMSYMPENMVRVISILIVITMQKVVFHLFYGKSIKRQILTLLVWLTIKK